MKHLVGLSTLMLVTASCVPAPAEGQDIRSCKFEAKARCASGEVRVTLAGGVVTKLALEIDWCGRRGQPGYSCTIDTSRTDKDSEWTEDQGATLITNASPFNPAQPDRVKITAGRHVSVDLDETQSGGRCGVGAELPRAIVIPAQSGTCRVWLRTH